MIILLLVSFYLNNQYGTKTEYKVSEAIDASFPSCILSGYPFPKSDRGADLSPDRQGHLRDR